MHKITGLQAADLRQHQRQQRIAGDVERHAEENIGAALIQLAAEFAVGHIKLKKRVARRQRHLVEFGHIPRRHDDATRIRVVFEVVQHSCNLVDVAAIRGRPATPLFAVHRPQVTVFIGPFVPDAHAIFLQITDIGVALQKPQQLVNDRAQMAFFGGDQREALGKVEAHLVAE